MRLGQGGAERPSSPFLSVLSVSLTRVVSLFLLVQPLPNIPTSDSGGLVDARKDAMKMNLDSCRREVIPASFSSEETTVFVAVGGVYLCPVCGIFEAGVQCVEGQTKGGVE